MIECRACGANCDPSDIKNGLCDDCRSPEIEFRILPKNTDARRQMEYERIERRKPAWQHCFN